MTWLLTVFWIILFTFIVTLILWGRYKRSFNRQILVSIIFAFCGAVMLLWFQGGSTVFNPTMPFENRVLTVIIVIFTFNTLVQLAKWILSHYIIEKLKINFPVLILDTITILMVAGISLITISRVFDIPLSGLLFTSTIVSAVIGLSLQSILGNFFEGIVLQIESPYGIGDWVEVAGQEGQVVSQNWRTMAVLTRENHHILLTNSDVAQEKMINFSRPRPRQAQDVFVDVDEKFPPATVMAVLYKAAQRIDKVIYEEPVEVLIDDFADATVRYRVRYWIDDFEFRSQIRSIILQRIWYHLNREDLEFSTPEQNIYLHNISPESELIKKSQRDKEIADVLQTISFLAELNQDQIMRIAAVTDWDTYTTGEYLIHQGAEGDSLFIIKGGTVGIYIDREGAELRVDERITNEFFGEMSLLTGEPRSASAVAETETEVLIIDKQAFAEVLSTDPVILDLMLDALDARLGNLQAKIVTADEQTRKNAEVQRNALIGKITQFLGISSSKKQDGISISKKISHT
ncbi:mechanosensitive ion channel family protein [Anaerolineales bacterium HSG24]|nr:mechanosensitive ion channel family protein [Anaerolineales bacterium HSG24]